MKLVVRAREGSVMKKQSVFWSLLLVASCGLCTSAAQADASLPERDLASDVLAVFKAKCAGCHGPDLEKPHGRFGYVLDLRRVAQNPEMVIPGRPNESELWILVSRNEMPFKDSPRGPLSEAQKETIREWIAAGAPAGPPGGLEGTSLAPLEPATAERVPASFSIGAFFRWLGKFHLLFIHFPIALVITAGVAEVQSRWRRDLLPSEEVRFSLRLAALAAIPTAALGWLFASSGMGAHARAILFAHRWLGTTTAAWVVVTALLAERDARHQKRSWSTRLLLAVGVALTALTAHLGGLMARGADFFSG